MTALKLTPDQEALIRVTRAIREKLADPLRIYRPISNAIEEFHRSNCRKRLVRGGNQCLGAEQPILDPVTGRTTPIGAIKTAFHVLSVCPETGETITCKASAPFVKAIDALYEFTLSSGQKLVATLDHRVLNSDGRWSSMADVIRDGVAIAHSRQFQAKTCVNTRTSATCQSPEPHALVREIESSSRTQIDAANHTQGHLDLENCSQSCEHGLSQSKHGSRTSLPSELVRARDTAESTHRLQVMRSSWLRRHRESAFARLRSTSGIALACAVSVLHCSQTIADSQVGYRHEYRSYDERPHAALSIDLDASPSRVDVLARIAQVLREDGQGNTPAHIRHDRVSFRPSSLDGARLVADPACEAECQDGALLSVVPQATSQARLQFLPSICALGDTAFRATQQSTFDASHPLKLAPRDTDNATVTSVRFLRVGIVYDISVEYSRNYIASGIFNANSSKTTSCMLEIISALRRIPLTGINGQPLPHKYSLKNTLRWWFIGYGEGHISETFYPKLLKPGLFDVIDDPVTQEPRLFQPNNPWDIANEHLKYKSPPLIPEGEIAHIAWKSAGEHVLSNIELKNGNSIGFMTSKGDLIQGATIDGGVWVDEDVEKPEYVNDWQVRLSKSKGWFTWSAFPWSHNEALKNLIDLAESESHLPAKERSVEQYRLTYSGNRFIDEKTKRDQLKAWAAQGPVVLAARDLGDYDNNKTMMYWEYQPGMHVVDPNRPSAFEKLHPVDQILLDNNGEPPADWMRFLTLDPGSAKAGVGFYAVPPPPYDKFLVLYDEIFAEQSDAESLADQVLLRTQGRQFYRFIIDDHAARKTPEGAGRTVRSFYIEAFTKRSIKCEQTGANFIKGTDNIEVRTSLVRKLLKPAEHVVTKNKTDTMFLPSLRVWGPRCPRFEWEIKRYERLIKKDESQDVPVAKNCEMMHCLEYAAGSLTPYTAPKSMRRPQNKKEWDAYFDKRHNRDPHARNKPSVIL